MTEINPKLLKPYDPKETEQKIYKKWEESGYFKPNCLPGKRGKKFSMMIAPPNITGSLHLGHALENTISDILIRWQRMQGKKTLWLPGLDHAGIATQNVVEKTLKKHGLSRHDLGREKFLEKIWEWRREYGNTISEQLKKLGCSLDWSRTRFTMDEDYQEAVKTAFNHYQKKKLVYQGEKVINWCIKDQTALSDLEIEYEQSQASLWHIKYPLSGGKEFITVATTRPETMLGDTAVAVHPNDKRYKTLIGQKVDLPIVQRKIPIIADKSIDREFGTGAVKVTPAHSMADSEIALRHNLPYLKIIDEFGKIINVNQKFNGLKIKEAANQVIEELKKLELLEKEEPINHNIAKCYRCNSVVEPLLSKQWFLKMESFSQKAIAAIKKGDIKYRPEKWKKISLNWLLNVKDWCISRQIWWGHKIPIESSKDVFDTWFSSALWPFAALGWPKKTKDLKEFYPTDAVTSARDIIHLWISRMIFSGLEFMDKPPFKTVIVHGTILNKEGKRMSKSLGTGIDPIDLIEKYGADGLRFGLIYQDMGGQDIKFSEDHVIMGKKFCNKLWNVARFVMSKTNEQTFSDLPPPKEKIGKTGAEAEILKKLEECRERLDQSLKNYRFGAAAHILYQFTWKEFADKYIEHSKTSENKISDLTLNYCLINILKMLHPFMPFVTEEIWSILPIKNKKKLMIEKWPR